MCLEHEMIDAACIVWAKSGEQVCLEVDCGPGAVCRLWRIRYAVMWDMG